MLCGNFYNSHTIFGFAGVASSFLGGGPLPIVAVGATIAVVASLCYIANRA